MSNILEQILLGNNDSSGHSGGVSLYQKSDKEKCAISLRSFAETYFPDVFTSKFSPFHDDVFDYVEDMILNKSKQKNFYVRAAPRSHGKSQIISFLLPLWVVCYSYRKNILIVSDSNDQAKQFVSAIKAELEDNEKLIADFGDLTGKVMWAQDRIVTRNGIHLIAKGATQKLRGIKFRSNRPDLVIIDDLENDEAVESETSRAKLKSWMLKALIPVGSPNVSFVYIGTIIHYEGLLNTILNNPQFSMWNRKVYQAVQEFSPSPLWNEWEKIITSDIKNPSDTAFSFYLKNKKKMLSGVKCLWPEKEEDYYYNLMVLKVMDIDSFNSEWQNNPISEESRIFKEQWLNEIIYEELPVEITKIAMAVDPSLGKSRRADTSAIMAIGLGTDNKMYTLTADICRRSPDKIMDDVILYAMKYYDKLGKFRVETNVWQEFFAAEMQKKCLSFGVYIDWDEIKHTRDKDLRIKSIVPSIKHGYIRIHKSHTVLLNQLKNYPKSKDDGVDCLQMCIDALVGVKSLSTFAFTSLSTTLPKASLSIFSNRR